MSERIILASTSTVRRKLLDAAKVCYTAVSPKIDEMELQVECEKNNMSPQKIASALAAAKALHVSDQHPGCVVIGDDQVLSLNDLIIGKPKDVEDATRQLGMLRGKVHRLYTAVALCRNGEIVWSDYDINVLKIKNLSKDQIVSYLFRNWQSVKHSPGAYKLEEEGLKLFSELKGDLMSALGFPLVKLLQYLVKEGICKTPKSNLIDN